MSAPTALSADRLRDFSTRFHGDIIRPDSTDYDAARSVWNGMIDRRPACIARCKTVADVQAAIRFGRDNDLPIAIRGGGHNVGGLAVVDEGLVIDLGGMRDVSVNPATRTASVGGGATWADFDKAAAAHGLATTGGVISTTGVAGLTLGGGLGWLMRSYGMACDNLAGADVVTAEGQLLHASATDNPDLFWALRGGGGNFGVVTTLEFNLHPVSTIFGGMLLYPLARARDVYKLMRAVTQSAPDALMIVTAMLHSPEGVPVVGIAMCYNGSLEDAERAIKPIRDFGAPIAGEVGLMPYPAVQQMLDEGFPKGLQVHWRSEFLADLSDELIDAMVAAYETVPSPLSAMLIEQFGGAVQRVPRDAMAYDQRDAGYNVVIISRWADPSEADRNVAWARSTSEAVRRFTNGHVYVNYIDQGEGTDRVRAAFGPDKFARLAAIKKTYDPGNVFRMNQNIPPG